MNHYTRMMKIVGCKSKVAFHTYHLVMRALTSTLAHDKKRRGPKAPKKLHPYRSVFCRQYHIGGHIEI